MCSKALSITYDTNSALVSEITTARSMDLGEPLSNFHVCPLSGDVKMPVPTTPA